VHFIEVNVATRNLFKIKVETLFLGANVFREGGRKIARGGGKKFPPVERKYFLPIVTL